MIKIIIIVCIIILLLFLYNKYIPKVDVILSNGNYVFIMWYNGRDNNGNYVRTYKRLLTL
nr:MAG TPA: hypothetical protein [Bacteriophage sp.]